LRVYGAQEIVQARFGGRAGQSLPDPGASFVEALRLNQLPKPQQFLLAGLGLLPPWHRSDEG
jgi:hypothetical protein